MHRIKAEKRQKDQQKKQKATENRKHLANVREHFQAQNEIIVQNWHKMAIVGLQHVGNKQGWIFKIFEQQSSLT